MWLEPSRHNAVPVLEASPVTVKKESASVLMVTPLVPFGEKVD